MRTQKPSVKLEGWAVVPGETIGTYGELEAGNLLVGRAFGHHRINEGMFIVTSAIVYVDKESQVAETRNTAYSLGEASPEYQVWAQDHSNVSAA